MILLSIVRILYSLMLIILASFIVGIIVVDVVKLVCFSFFYIYIYILFIVYCKYNLQTNDGGGDQNVDKNTEDDFEVENDSQKDNDSDDD